MVVVPRILSQQSATSKIAKYLHRLLRPFVDRILMRKSFYDEFDCIRKLHHYASTTKCLRSTTLFCTIKVLNYYALVQHKTMIDVVSYFLQDNLVTNKLEQVSIVTIQNLLQLFLYNNIFCYQDKIYTMTKGSPKTMPVSDLLASIYVFEWQKIIVKEVEQNNELFGR